MGIETPRAVFVAEDLFGIVKGPFGNTREDRRHASLRAFFDGFSEGNFITVAEDPFRKPRHAMVARTHPVSSGVFAFRCLAPNPGMRAFGFFAEVDTFVALTWNYRENIEDGAGWVDEMTQCEARWNELFGALSPVKGRMIYDYISYNVDIV